MSPAMAVAAGISRPRGREGASIACRAERYPVARAWPSPSPASSRSPRGAATSTSTTTSPTRSSSTASSSRRSSIPPTTASSRTRSLDGDPLDVMVCVSEPTFPGCMIDVKPIALFRMEDDKGIDDKVLCVPLTDPGWNTLESLDDLSDQLQDEIAHFFSVYKELEQKKVKVDGWYSREDAMKEIDGLARALQGRVQVAVTRVPPPCPSSRRSSSGSCRGSPSSCRSRAPRTCASCPPSPGWEDPGAAFTAITQLGTMAAVLLYFRNDLLRIARAWLRSLRDRAAAARRSTRGSAGTSCSARSRSGSSGWPSRTRSRTARATST